MSQINVTMVKMKNKRAKTKGEKKKIIFIFPLPFGRGGDIKHKESHLLGRTSDNLLLDRERKRQHVLIVYDFDLDP